MKKQYGKDILIDGAVSLEPGKKTELHRLDEIKELLEKLEDKDWSDIRLDRINDWDELTDDEDDWLKLLKLIKEDSAIDPIEFIHRMDSFIEPLLKLLYYPAWEVCNEALDILYRYRDKLDSRAFIPLVDALKTGKKLGRDGWESIVLWPASLLGDLCDPRAIEFLTKTLEKLVFISKAPDVLFKLHKQYVDALTREEEYAETWDPGATLSLDIVAVAGALWQLGDVSSVTSLVDVLSSNRLKHETINNELLDISSAGGPVTVSLVGHLSNRGSDLEYHQLIRYFDLLTQLPVSSEQFSLLKPLSEPIAAKLCQTVSSILDPREDWDGDSYSALLDEIVQKRILDLGKYPWDCETSRVLTLFVTALARTLWKTGDGRCIAALVDVLASDLLVSEDLIKLLLNISSAGGPVAGAVVDYLTRSGSDLETIKFFRYFDLLVRLPVLKEQLSPLKRLLLSSILVSSPDELKQPVKRLLQVIEE
ncbi:MAG: hypothetical protein ACFFD4_11520 [Candidatus Odinarchaeota archaeon]